MTDFNVSSVSSQPITKSQKKELQKQAKEAKKQHKIDIYNEAEKIRLGYTSEETKYRHLRKDVKQYAKDEYNVGNITKEEYKAVKKQTRDSWASRFARTLGLKKESDAVSDYKTDARNNQIEMARFEFATGERKLNKHNQAILDKTNRTIDEVYDIAKKQYGSNNYVDYSYSKGSKGATNELRGIAGELGITQAEAHDLLEAMKIPVESKIRGGYVAREAGKGAAVGALGFFIDQTQTTDISTTGSLVEVTGKIKQHQNVGLATLATGIVLGAIKGISDEIHRTEPKVADKQLPQEIKTFDDYKAYVENGCTDKGADIMLKIANFYKNEDGTLNVKEMQKALEEAAGDNSVLNYKEARALYAELVRGKDVPAEEVPVEKEEPVEEPVEETTCNIVDKAPTKQTVEKEVATHCHTIKKGDNWTNVLAARYGVQGDDLKALVKEMKEKYYEANKADLNKKGINSAKGAFFIQGKEWCLPETVEVNGKKYEYKENVNYQAGTEFGKTAGVSNESVKHTRKEEQTVYHVGNECDDHESTGTDLDKVRAAERKYVEDRDAALTK